MNMNNKNICILGTGAWATSLGCCLSKNNHKVIMWGIKQSEIDDLNNGYNKSFYNDQKLFAKVEATNDLKYALEEAEYILIAVPSTFITDVLSKVKPLLKEDKKYIFINVAKGLDQSTQDVWSKSIHNQLNGLNAYVSTLIGPSFAIDVFNQKPTVINIVSNNNDISKEVAQLFNSNFFKAVVCDDEIGAQVLAALKNLLAIAIGISQENHNSINTISALLTQGVNEMQDIAIKMGSKPNTILQFCGIGDIFLTCTSDKSRNFTFGREIFRDGIESILANNNKTVEGYKVFPIVKEIIDTHNLNVPIFKLIIKVLNKEIKPSLFVDYVLNEIISNNN